MAYRRTEEFDAFGPWIWELDEKHQIPPFFKAYEAETAQARMSFKIPVKVERRNANPDMHLYRCVVVLKDTDILILDKHADKAAEKRVTYSSIEAIRVTTNLLAGELALFTRNDVIRIHYNCVSQRIIMKAVRIIRKVIEKPPVDLRLKTLSYSHQTIEYLYANLLNQLRAQDPFVKLLAYQPNLDLSVLRNVLQRAWDRMTSRRQLQSTAFAASRNELIVICRKSPIKAETHTDYSYAYMYIPIKNIKRIQLTTDRKISGITHFVISTETHIYSIPTSGNGIAIEALAEALRTLS